MFCRNSLQRNLQTCPPANLSKTMHNIWLWQSRKMGAYLYTTTFDDLIFEFSSKQHCTTISRRVVHWVKGLIKASFFCIKKPNLMTRSNLQTQFWNMHQAQLSQLKSHTWKGTRSLAFVNESQTCFENQKGIHIGRIVSNFLAHMSTPNMKIACENWTAFL